MARSKKKKKRHGPFKADEIESVQKKPKKKKRKKLLPDEPWLDQQKYFQDNFSKKGKKDPRWEAEKKREPWIWDEGYYQDQYDKEDEKESDKKEDTKRRKRSRGKKKN